ncbi:hypothetical protein CRUP_034145 [Coryphaenoides rupestris]|nr:hypothetical protein CRUP_034145 [Coryphaenoides rupestris]
MMMKNSPNNPPLHHHHHHHHNNNHHHHQQQQQTQKNHQHHHQQHQQQQQQQAPRERSHPRHGWLSWRLSLRGYGFCMATLLIFCLGSLVYELNGGPPKILLDLRQYLGESTYLDDHGPPIPRKHEFNLVSSEIHNRTRLTKHEQVGLSDRPLSSPGSGPELLLLAWLLPPTPLHFPFDDPCVCVCVCVCVQEGEVEVEWDWGWGCLCRCSDPHPLFQTD